ncbi:hypothetical protein [Deinococcus peraridilitoris]|uniref:Uncharacterized protein n=1 Tax=Deinococcus peraridilitoris (strain DSM 19664 / LMG 22246 / CIP 109416 / KR-200) TaxID=937777 RepID=L0A593_DEIPD|nr:hypothetical protein [Deinococcus peraridilitoris]AFZ68352.1 hypothetical protein Deipe_2891 [Deinococcus peraridilitoris DSM 19664]
MQKVTERITPLLWAAVALLALLAGVKTTQHRTAALTVPTGIAAYCLPLLHLNETAAPCGIRAPN